MKKILAITFTLTLLLVGCTSDKYKSEYSAAQQSFSQNKYNDTLTHLLAAQREAPSDANVATFLNNLYSKTVTDGNTNFDAKDYKDALSDYSVAVKIKNVDPALSQRLDATKTLLDRQTKLQAYADWYKDFSKRYTATSSQFRNLSDSFQIGSLKDTDFAQQVKSTILTADMQLVNESEQKALQLDTEVGGLHTTLQKSIEDNHNIIIHAVGCANTQQDSCVVSDEQYYLKNANDISNFIQTLKNYSDQNSLGINF